MVSPNLFVQCSCQIFPVISAGFRWEHHKSLYGINLIKNMGPTSVKVTSKTGNVVK